MSWHALTILIFFSGDHADEQHGWQAGNPGSGAESLVGKGISKGMVLKGGLCEPVMDSLAHADRRNIYFHHLSSMLCRCWMPLVAKVVARTWD